MSFYPPPRFCVFPRCYSNRNFCVLFFFLILIDLTFMQHLLNLHVCATFPLSLKKTFTTMTTLLRKCFRCNLQKGIARVLPRHCICLDWCLQQLAPLDEHFSSRQFQIYNLCRVIVSYLSYTCKYQLFNRREIGNMRKEKDNRSINNLSINLQERPLQGDPGEVKYIRLPPEAYNSPIVEALPNKAWLALVGRLCPMRPGWRWYRIPARGSARWGLVEKALFNEAWYGDSTWWGLVEVRVEVLLKEAWYGGSGWWGLGWRRCGSFAASVG